MKNKIIATLLLAVMLISSVGAVFAAEDKTITVFVDGNKLSFDVPPTSENGRTLVPMRAIFEALDAKVEWIGEENKVVATKNDTVVELVIGSNIMVKNGEEIVLDVPAKATDGRTLVPVRAISEALDANVEWIGEEFKVDIKSMATDGEELVAGEAGARETVQAFIDAAEDMDFFKALDYMKNGEEIRATLPEGTYAEIMAGALTEIITQGTGALTGVDAPLKETLPGLLGDILEAYATKLECTITDVKETANGYTYTVSITMPDEESLNKFSTDIDVNAISTEIATKLALEGKISPTATEGEVMAIMLPMVMEEVLPLMKDIVYKADTKTETEEITVEQIDGKWKITAGEFTEEIFDISSLTE